MLIVVLFLCLFQCFFTVDIDSHDFAIYLDNFTLCQQHVLTLDRIDKGKIYSHRNFHDGIFYLADHHCSLTIETKRRAWISIEEFQTNSSVAFPRCTEAKYAGNDDRLQILDGFQNGSILRILCGKQTDQRFDRSPLILKSSKFTLDWRTKSQSTGFVLSFVLYDLARDGSCVDSSQFQCRNNRCISRRLICSDDELCADRSHFEHPDRLRLCSTTFFRQISSKQIESSIFFIVIAVLLFVCLIFGFFCLRRRKKSSF